jgi:hypothetical protein
MSQEFKRAFIAISGIAKPLILENGAYDVYNVLTSRVSSSLAGCCGSSSRQNGQRDPNRRYDITHVAGKPDTVPNPVRPNSILIPDASMNLLLEWGTE